MKVYLKVLAGVMLAVSVFAQEIAEIPAEDTIDTEAAAAIAEVPAAPVPAPVVSVAQANPISDTITTSDGVVFVKTEYVIDRPQSKRRAFFCGGAGFSVSAFDMSPVRHIIAARETEELRLSDTAKTLRISDYNFLNEVSKREAILSGRALFYGINKSKFHIGGVLEVAGSRWDSRNSEKDSILTMLFISVKTGVLMEQVLWHNDKNYLALGGTVGTGWNGVIFTGRREGSGHFWGGSSNNYDWENKDWENKDWEKDYLVSGSSFVSLDLNLTYIVQVAKVLHLRFDALCNIMGSNSGYGFSGDRWGIVNPGGAFSLIFGRKQ